MAQIKFSRNYPGVVPKAPAIPDGETGETKYLREDGTWAEPPGAGGSSTLEGLEDVDISDPESGQGLVYNEETGNWENGDVASDMEEITYEYYLAHKAEIEASDKTYLVTGPLVTPSAAGGGVNIYSTDEHVVGRWIDGKPIYELVHEYTEPIRVVTSGWTDIGINISNIETALNGFAIDKYKQYFSLAVGLYGDGRVAGTLATGADASTRDIKVIVIQYTKTTDTPVSLVPYVYPSSSIKGLVADTGTQQVPFRFTYNQTTQKYGYLDGADTFHPFSEGGGLFLDNCTIYTGSPLDQDYTVPEEGYYIFGWIPGDSGNVNNFSSTGRFIRNIGTILGYRHLSLKLYYMNSTDTVNPHCNHKSGGSHYTTCFFYCRISKEIDVKEIIGEAYAVDTTANLNVTLSKDKIYLLFQASCGRGQGSSCGFSNPTQSGTVFYQNYIRMQLISNYAGTITPAQYGNTAGAGNIHCYEIVS